MDKKPQTAPKIYQPTQKNSLHSPNAQAIPRKSSKSPRKREETGAKIDHAEEIVEMPPIQLLKLNSTPGSDPLAGPKPGLASKIGNFDQRTHTMKPAQPTMVIEEEFTFDRSAEVRNKKMRNFGKDTIPPGSGDKLGANNPLSAKFN